MENIIFYEQINLFLENKDHKTLGLHTHTHVYVRRSEACVRKHGPADTTRVIKTYERQVFYINVEVWNESHIA